MRKEIRAEINRANAQKSTGPKTTQGKQQSCMNAFKHGLTGQKLILQPDELEAYDRLTNSLLAETKPKTALEHQIAQKLIDSHFRLNRLAGIENNIFNFALLANITGTDDDERLEIMQAQTRAWTDSSSSFDLLGRYEARLSRQALRYSLELERLQAVRINKERLAIPTEPTENYRDSIDSASFPTNLPSAVMSATVNSMESENIEAQQKSAEL
ncbi:MAG: hypothetical protein ABSG41_13490 [Bryobacteraceae bacterium]|jgi:hypothetical protein